MRPTLKELVLFFAQYEAVTPTFKFGDPEAHGYFRRLGKALLSKFYPDYERTAECDWHYPIKTGPFRWQNPKATGKLIAPVRILTIASFYPTMIAQLIGEGILTSNVPQLLSIYSALVDHRVEARKHLASHQYLHWKAFLNMFYGMTGHGSTYFRVGGLEQVVLRGRALWEKFVEVHGQRTAYVDIDTAYLRVGPLGHSGEVEQFFQDAGFIIDIELAEQATFFEADRYMVWTAQGIKYNRITPWK